MLVLWAAALHHHSKGNENGVSRLVLRALERLGELDVSMPDIDLEGLREGLVTSLESAKTPWSTALKPQWPQPFGLSAQFEQEQRCPYCGDSVLVSVAPEESDGARYVEDCPTCCRPWSVELTREGEGFQVRLGTDDA